MKNKKDVTYQKANDFYQLSDEFYKHIVKYLIINHENPRTFCEKNRLNYYIFYKVMNRDIKMHIQFSYLYKLSLICGINNCKLEMEQKTIRKSDKKNVLI